MAEKTNEELLVALSARFPTDEVKERSQGNMKLSYIAINSVQNRLDAILGPNWSFVGETTELSYVPEVGFVALVSGHLDALGKRAYGVGADTDKRDPDKAIKTARAEALKKAATDFGIARYLWDEGERAILARDRAIAGGDLDALKGAVFEKALNAGAKATKAGVAKHYGVGESDLQDVDTLQRLLTG